MMKFEASDGQILEATQEQISRSAFLSSLAENRGTDDSEEKPLGVALKGFYLRTVLDFLSLPPLPGVEVSDVVAAAGTQGATEDVEKQKAEKGAVKECAGPFPVPLPPNFLFSASVPAAHHALVCDLSREQLALLMSAADFLYADGLVALCGVALALVARAMCSAAEVRDFFTTALPSQLLRVVAGYSDLDDVILLNHHLNFKKRRVDLADEPEIEIHFEEYKHNAHKSWNTGRSGQKAWTESHVLTYKKRRTGGETVSDPPAAELLPAIPLVPIHNLDSTAKRAIHICESLTSGHWSVDDEKVARAVYKSGFVKHVKKIVVKRTGGWALGRVLGLNE